MQGVLPGDHRAMMLNLSGQHSQGLDSQANVLLQNLMTGLSSLKPR